MRIPTLDLGLNLARFAVCPFRIPHSAFRNGFLLVAALLTSAGFLDAGEVQLKNGLRLQGHLDPVHGLTLRAAKQHRGNINAPTMLMVETKLNRYFIGDKQVGERVFEDDLGHNELFKLAHKKTGQRPMVASLGAVSQTEPFDKFGVRTVQIRTDRGPLDIVQAISELGPKYVHVVALTHHWEFGIATTSLPPDQLDAILRQATEAKNPDDRMAIARFYLEAGMHAQANAEVASIIRDFPELKAATEKVADELQQLQANELLAELRRRQQAGQHLLAVDAIKRFPIEGMKAAVLRQVREMNAEYDKVRENIDHAISRLGDLQAELKDPQHVAAIAPFRSVVCDALDIDSLPRLDAFLKLADDPTLAAQEKLALAYSGWLVGSEHAFRDLDETVRLWNAWYIVGEYLRTEDATARANQLAELRQLESVGIDRIMQMVPQLPLPVESPGVVPGQAAKVEAKATASESSVKYSVLLPPEYTPFRTYPLIVALRPAERTTDAMLNWWGGEPQKPGQSQRQGYIVIAPEYVAADKRTYDYNFDAHHTVLESIRDVRKRFNVDSDRIFLTGHGMGGDAAFDMGMSHPDLFAGVIPITGISRHYCVRYWENAKHVPFYIVGGELDRNSFEQNAELGKVDNMMRAGFNVVYCDYMGRGYEPYYEEIFKLFEWMALCRRVKNLKDFDMKVLRPSEDRFYWMQGDGFPQQVVQPVVFGPNQQVPPQGMTFSASVKPDNSIFIQSGARRHILWLSPEIVNFEERVKVRFKGQLKFNQFVKPDVETLLEDLRTRGDRQNLYTAKLDVQ